MKTDRSRGMQESHVEGLAGHNGPERCGGGGNIAAEALAEGGAGVVLSPEIGSKTGPGRLRRGPHSERQGVTAVMHGNRESDSRIVAEKPSNNERATARTAERVEPRGLARDRGRHRRAICGRFRHRLPAQVGRRTLSRGPGHALATLRLDPASDQNSSDRVRPLCESRSRRRFTYGSVRGVPRKGHPYRDITKGSA